MRRSSRKGNAVVYPAHGSIRRDITRKRKQKGFCFVVAVLRQHADDQYRPPFERSSVRRQGRTEFIIIREGPRSFDVTGNLSLAVVLLLLDIFLRQKSSRSIDLLRKFSVPFETIYLFTGRRRRVSLDYFSHDNPNKKVMMMISRTHARSLHTVRKIIVVAVVVRALVVVSISRSVEDLEYDACVVVVVVDPRRK